MKDATNTGIRVSSEPLSMFYDAGYPGIDVRLGELAELIQETMESYGAEVDGKIIPGTVPRPLPQTDDW